MVSRYQGKQEGLCFLPPPPTHHYRMMPPQRPDFHVSNPQQSFVPPQPPNQATNQGPGIRAMAPTGPPNQASTPPNSDIKVANLPQNLNLPFNRGGPQNFYRPPAPTNQSSRMASRPTHQIYPSQMQYIQPGQHIYYNNPMVMFGSTPRQATNFVPPNFHIMGQTYMSYTQPTQAPHFLQYPPTQFSTIPRPVTPAPVQMTPQNINQPAPTIPINQNIQPHGTTKKKERRTHAIPVIDPNTGKDMLNEVFEKESPDSADSSARQTPQPTSHNKDIQAAFAQQVAQAINDEIPIEDSDHTSHDMPVETHLYHHQAVQNSSREHLAQSSKLQPQTKEFVPTIPSNTTGSTKETPVVSAITDSVEVTVKPKDRESPIKSGRKQRETRESQREHKDSVKDVPQKESVPEKAKEETKVASSSTAPPKEVRENTSCTEKRNQKKEKSDSKPTIAPSVGSESTPECVPQQLAAPQTSEISKNKNSQRKDPPKQQAPAQNVATTTPQQQQQKQGSVHVPQSQPSKPNNKSNRVREINSKGATKEGTDMDAFNDKATPPSDVNSVSNAIPSDIFNTNSISSNVNNNNTETRSETTRNEPRTDNKTDNINNPSNADRTIKATEYKPLTKGKCVTDIVKDVPKPIKIAAPVVEPTDEPDRALSSNEKIVQAKNEANSKANIENDSNLDNKLQLPYKEGQWSPLNPTGRKVYDRDFLLALKDDPKSRKKPSVALNECVAVDEKRGGDMGRYAMGGRADFTPNFGGANYNAKSASLSRSGKVASRKSLQGPAGGNNRNSTKKVVSISLKEDVKLHETDNAWKPARLNPSETMTDEDRKTAVLYKKVRGILNKLTPQKFDILVSQVRELNIDTTQRLQGVIDLVFEKAVDEPNFSEAYANMCKELALMMVPVAKKEDEKDEKDKANNASKEKDNRSEEFTSFRKLLVTRCQLEFERNAMDDNEKARRHKEIEECTDPEKKKGLLMLLEEDERRIRKKSVGNIRFIGELFKQQMLTTNIMQRCLNNLLMNKDEENLECLCKLLTTIGYLLDPSKKSELNHVFNEMHDIAKKSNPYKISSRVRFMLQDTIDLRANGWVPRRTELAPKTMDQIQKEAENEQLNIQAMNSMPAPPRKDDRGNSGQTSDRKGGRRNTNITTEEGWTISSRNRTAQFMVQSDKLKNKTPQIDEPLGSTAQFSYWACGSNINKPQNNPVTNIYSCLENNLDSDKRILGSRPSSSRDSSYNSKGPSIERYNKYDGRGSRSGSQHRSNDNKDNRDRDLRPQPPIPNPMPKLPPPATTQHRPNNNAAPFEKNTAAPAELSDAQDKWVTNRLEELIGDCCTVEECHQEIASHLPKNVLSAFVEKTLMYTLEKAKSPRIRTGKLFASLVTSDVVSLDVVCENIENIIFNQAEDLIIDMPKLWVYVAELLFYLVCDNALPFSRLGKMLQPVQAGGNGAKVLEPLFHLFIEDKGPNFLQHIWQTSECTLKDFIAENEIDAFVSKNKLEFLTGSDVHPIGQSTLTYDQIHDKLMQFFENNESFDVTVNWIIANIGDRVKENQFIRTLATAVFENSIRGCTYYPETLKKHRSLIHKFIDHNPNLELQCLIALQLLVTKLEHPKGVLLAVCTDLYYEYFLSQDAFVQWRHGTFDPADMEGRGVALTQLGTFFFNMSQEMSDASDEA